MNRFDFFYLWVVEKPQVTYLFKVPLVHYLSHYFLNSIDADFVNRYC